MIKSKYFVVLGFVLISFVQGEMTEEMKQMAKLLRTTCIAETGVSEDVITATGKGIFAEDEKLKCYMKCVYINIGVFSEEDSSLDEKALIGMAPENMQDTFEDTLKKCTPLSGNTNCDKTFNLSKCIYKQEPEKYVVI